MHALVTSLLFLLCLILSYTLPRTRAYLLAFGAIILVPGTVYSSEVPVLLGVVIGAGVHRLRAGGLRALMPTYVQPVVPLLLLGSWAIASMLVNVSAYDALSAEELLVGTRWLAIRLALLSLVIAWEEWRLDDLAIPLTSAVAFLTLVRVGEGMGIEPANTFSTSFALLSNVHDTGALNLYAALLALVVPVTLWKGLHTDRSTKWAWRAATLLFVWAVAATDSRTGILIVIVQCLIAVAFATSWRQRAWVGLVLTFFIAVGSVAGHLTSKPIFETVTEHQHVGGSTEAAPDLGTPEQTPEVTRWRGLLWTPEVEVRQRISVETPPADPTLYVEMRRGYESELAGVEVLVNGEIATIIPPERIPVTAMEWVEVPLAPALVMDKSSIHVSLRLAGPGDMTRNYVEIGGLSGVAADYASAFYNGVAEFATDLSPDPGRQVGLYQMFLGEQQPPDLIAIMSPEAQTALSSSLSDRVMLWRAAALSFLDRPLTGSGLYTFRWIYPQYLAEPMFHRYANAHNMYLQVASDLGLIGTLIFIWLVCRPVVEFARTWLRRSPTSWAPLLSTMSIALTSLMHTWIADVRYYLPALLVLAVATSRHRHTIAPHQQAPVEQLA